MKQLVFFIIILLCVVTSMNSQKKESPEAVELPDTPAGRCALSYFKAFNSDSDQEMRRFIKQYRQDDYSVEKGIQNYLMLHKIWKGLIPVRIVQSLKEEITLLVLPSSQKEALVFRLHLDRNPPHRISYFTRTGVGLPIGGIEEISDWDILGIADRARPVDTQICTRTVVAFSEAIARNYIYPQKGEDIAGELMKYLKNGRYKGLKKAGELAEILTKDVFSLSYDGHLWLEASNPHIQSIYRYNHPVAELEASHFDFQKVEVLPGNIGYIKFNYFHEYPEALDVAVRALNQVAECDALIFDIRDNMGGGGKMLRLILSYLFEMPTIFSETFNREGKVVSRLETITEIPGRRFSSQVPVFVLTSSQTGSAAEAFAYILKHFGRARIVGEKTIGMAHPSKEIVINYFFRASIPYLRSKNSITGKDWEGVGVIPDIQVSADQALEIAMKSAHDRDFAFLLEMIFLPLHQIPIL